MLTRGQLNYIEVRLKNHADMRYDTYGDYYYVDYGNSVRMDLSNILCREEQLLTLVHELVEMILVEKAGVEFKSVDDWDLKHLESPDPGSLKKCPYRKEHMFAARVEGLMRKEIERRNKNVR